MAAPAGLDAQRGPSPLSRDSRTSLWADSRSPWWRTAHLPVRGQLISLGLQAKGITPRPVVASVRRSEVPSVMMTWAWWRSRSTAMLTRVIVRELVAAFEMGGSFGDEMTALLPVELGHGVF